MCLICCSVLQPPCPPSYVLKESRWACCRSDGPLMEGGPFKGHPLLGRARPSRPEDKLKSIVANLHYHLSPALADQKKQTTRAELEWPKWERIATTRRPGSLLLVGPLLGIKDQEALIARCPNFSRGFHTDRAGAGTHAQIVGCLLWTGVGCAMVHGVGPASGQAGLDGTGPAGQASERIPR